jgi:hypothetical protein
LANAENGEDEGSGHKRAGKTLPELGNVGGWVILSHMSNLAPCLQLGCRAYWGRCITDPNRGGKPMKSFAWQRFVDEPYLITEIEIVPIVSKDKVVIIHVRTREPRQARAALWALKDAVTDLLEALKDGDLGAIDENGVHGYVRDRPLDISSPPTS